jgi:hypothetical protein
MLTSSCGRYGTNRAPNSLAEGSVLTARARGERRGLSISGDASLLGLELEVPLLFRSCRFCEHA